MRRTIAGALAVTALAIATASVQAIGAEARGVPSLACPSAAPVPGPTAVPISSPAPDAEASANPSPPAEASVEVEALDLYFRPTEIVVPAAGASRIVLTNLGYAAHNLTVDELDVELVVGRGGTDALTLVDPPAGTYTFYCSVSGHREAGMIGTLIVE